MTPEEQRVSDQPVEWMREGVVIAWEGGSGAGRDDTYKPIGWKDGEGVGDPGWTHPDGSAQVPQFDSQWSAGPEVPLWSRGWNPDVDPQVRHYLRLQLACGSDA